MVASRALAALALLLAACSLDDAPVHDDPEPTGETSLALNDADPVSLAADESCTTTSVKGLSTQLVEEIQCLRPGTMKSIEGASGLALSSAVFPWLQTKAAEAITLAQKERGVTLAINSALRTLPQQYLLYRWYQAKRCGIGLAARPGQSNHESGLAVDVEDNAGWQKSMAAHDMKWLGASDPVHFDYVGEGRVDLGGLSVLAFQRLWNRNHPEDPIAEDGAYGDETEKRVARSPVGGFAKGADCSATAPEPPTPAPASGATNDDASKTQGARNGAGDSGCSTTRGRPEDLSLAAIGAVLALVVLRRSGSGGSAPRRAGSRRRR